MTQAIDRRQLLGGDFRGERAPIRPPWAVTEDVFIELCDRCADCIDVCSEKIIQKGHTGFPQLNFDAAGCTLCGDCVEACKPNALVSSPDFDTAPWSLKANIKNNCLSLNGTVCRSCGEACDERAITFKLAVGGVAEPLIDLAQCNGCGWCYGVCPVKSVRLLQTA